MRLCSCLSRIFSLCAAYLAEKTTKIAITSVPIGHFGFSRYYVFRKAKTTYNVGYWDVEIR
jgi:hypothetical protein